jgi:hypothetical protein
MSAAGAQRVLNTVWAVRSEAPAAQIRNELWASLPDGDGLLVLEVIGAETADWAGHQLQAYPDEIT